MDRFARTTDTGNCNYNQYCGGNFQGIINKLDYIKGMGFDAIWISPIFENMERSYHGYYITNFYNLNYHFGSEEDFKALVTACHKEDIWVMVDIVINNVAPLRDYSKITPFNSSEYYHDCNTIIPKTQEEYENCSTWGDLKQENEWVAQTLLNWISDLISKYNIDGIRIDTINAVPKWFLDIFREAAGVFQIGEVFNGDINYVAGYQNHLDSVFNYPLYYTIESSFCGSFLNLEGYWHNIRPIYPAPEYTATFLENHNNRRFLNRCNDRGKYTNAVIFSILWEGIPVFYYGGEQYYSGGDDPNNKEPLWDNYNTNTEMYRYIGKVNDLRKQHNIWNLSIIERYVDDYFYAFTRGNILACFSNTNSLQRSITDHEFSEGTKLCNILYDGDCVSVSGGSININMGNYPKIYVKQ